MQRLRSIAFAIFFGLSILVASIVAAPVALFSAKAARAVAKSWSRAILHAVKIIAGVSYKIEGEENIPQGGAIVAANHQSQWETIALYAHLPNPVVIAKKELFDIPIYGWWLRRVGNIAVDRAGGAKALRALRAEAAAHIANGDQIVVFPESTRAPVGEKLPFHPGVAGIYSSVDGPCVPAAHDSGLYWRYPGIDKVPGEITLKFLPPIAADLDRKTFLRELQSQIEKARPDLPPQAHAPERADG